MPLPDGIPTEAREQFVKGELLMNKYSTLFDYSSPYFWRRAAAVLILGIPAELLALKVLTIFINIMNLVGVF